MNTLERVECSLIAPGRCPSELDPGPRENGNAGGSDNSGVSREKRAIAKRKNYRRHPKPPYSYLALIAMVILNSPEKRQTLSQILQAMSRLSPFSSSEYLGWKDSVRHNLSANDCFVKVLKDPGKPRSKGNSWTVDPSRIPSKALRCQKMPVPGRDQETFARDLGTLLFAPRGRGCAGGGGSDQAWNPGSLLPRSLAGLEQSLNPTPPTSSVPAPAEHPQGQRPPPSSSSSGSDCEPETPTVRALPPWELPTSHTRHTPPNAMAPPSSGLPRPSIPGLPLWPLVPPNPYPSLSLPPNPGLDLDARLREVPPNKTVFDVLTPNLV
ncbi:forkhead box protein H1 [Scyliorhinus canicula]|uniref:forkhead box protein H1 n=1 Tax=Scyliorhinus canicula TaxID=7830 RepID=UPI0018F6E697|nr:forkhead box protein H1 [Scyliorhinus canicula]